MSFENLVVILCLAAGIILARKRIKAWLRLFLAVIALYRMEQSDKQAVGHAAQKIANEFDYLTKGEKL